MCIANYVVEMFMYFVTLWQGRMALANCQGIIINQSIQGVQNKEILPTRFQNLKISLRFQDFLGISRFPGDFKISRFLWDYKISKDFKISERFQDLRDSYKDIYLSILLH